MPVRICANSADAQRCRAARYVALRNIDIIVQRYPDLLANEVKVRSAPLPSICQALPSSAAKRLHLEHTQHAGHGFQAFDCILASMSDLHVFGNGRTAKEIGLLAGFPHPPVPPLHRRCCSAGTTTPRT